MLTYIVIVNTCLLPLAWLLGSEGTASIGLTQEVRRDTQGRRDKQGYLAGIAAGT